MQLRWVPSTRNDKEAPRYHSVATIQAHFPDTFLVVPISKTPPSPPENHHCEFKARAYPFFDPVESVWALANKLSCVKLQRLDRMWIGGRYTAAKIRPSDLQAVRRAVLHAMGMENWKDISATTRAMGSSKDIVPVEISVFSPRTGDVVPQ